MGIIIENSEDKDKVKEILKSSFPTYREAFSDRMCFIMACLSELVYLKFNKPQFSHSQKEVLTSIINDIFEENKASSIDKLFELLAYDNEKLKAELISNLKDLNIEVKEYFDTKGTQAILCESDKFYALVFRGTETNSIKDIKSDLDAKKTYCESGGNIHRGFKEAFRVVQKEIQDFIDEKLKDKPLMITGHSLGGALATIATKKLKYEKIAACYTFGSPRVGDEEWMLGIKPPVYRIVNSADPVTMLPPGSEIVDISSFILKFFPLGGEALSKHLESNYGGYSHAGYMRYLTNIENGRFEDANLVYSVSFIRRIRAYMFKKGAIKKLPADHSIKVYRKKLQAIAFKRQGV